MKIDKILSLLPHKTAYAHCDIPCGIYDPHNAQMAAHTVIRMIQLIEDVSATSPESPFEERKKIISQVSRITHVKEEHSNILEHELTTLENDYFKDEHYAKYKELKKWFSDANKLGTKARTEINMEAAKELLETVMKIAATFYDSKGLKSKRVKSPYPTELDIVVQS